MLKQVLASLLLVIIFFSQCIGADNEYIRKGWETEKTVDDLTDEIKSYQADLVYYKFQPTSFYRLSISCKINKKELDVTIGGVSKTSLDLVPIVGSGSRIKDEVTVEYRFNQESVLKEVWEKEKLANIFYFQSLNPVGFAQELLRVMEGDKTQLRFREIDRKTLHFSLHGGAPFVRDVLGKCNTLPDRGEE